MWLTYVDDTVVGEFPARLESEDAERVALLGGEVPQSGVRDVVGLQGELVEGGQKLGHGAHSLISDIDAVGEGEGHNPRCETRPQPRLRDLVTAGQFQFEQSLSTQITNTRIFN